jgi:hypothetical protein
MFCVLTQSMDQYARVEVIKNSHSLSWIVNFAY